jgi:hypothetical protein
MKPFSPNTFTDNKKSLTDVWRKIKLSTAMSAGLLALGGCASMNVHATGTPAAPEATRSDQAPLSLLTGDLREKAIRAALLADARAHYQTYAALAKTGYSQDLSALETRMSAYLRQSETGTRRREAILDPALFDVGMAFGMTSGQTVTAMFQAQQVSSGPKSVEHAVDYIFNAISTPYGPHAFNQEAHALIAPDDDASPKVCVIVPTSGYALQFDVPGFPTETSITFTNHHESWHCLDDRYVIPADFVEKQPKTREELHAALQNPALLETIATLARKESFADTGALGDMIRAGAPVSVIDNVIALRRTVPGDGMHYSPRVLRALKRTIAEMGLGNFRKLSHDQTKDLYYKLTDEHGLSARSLALFLQMEIGTPAEQAQAMAQIGTPDGQYALELFDYDLRTKQISAAAKNLPEAPLTPEENKIMRAVTQFKAGNALLETAFAAGGSITPKTLTAAYGRLQDDLLQDRRAHPERDLADCAKMSKLQETYITVVQSLDYESVNARYGVQITKVEPALRKFDAPSRLAVFMAAGNPAPAQR